MRAYKVIGAITLAMALLCCSACGGTAGEIDEMEPWTGGKVTEQKYADTYEMEECSLIGSPTVVCDVTSAAVLSSLTSTSWAPSNAILHFNKNYNIVDEEGKKLDSFANIYNNILKDKIIPILYLENEECADAAITFMKERMAISDMAIMSTQPAVVKKVRTAFPAIRGILAYDSLDSAVGVARTANAALAATVVLPQSAASVENVHYIQARFKSVWVKADSCDDVNIYDCMGSGAYGIIGSEYEKIYSLLSDCVKGNVRMPFNVAHRGLAYTYHENSVSGALAADAAGATHVELDGHLSKDGHIVMMHNSNISATTNGAGEIADKTLEELRQFKLHKSGVPDEEIPVLEDVIDALKGTDCVLMFEIKSGGAALIDKLQEIVEEKDFSEQMVIITFASDFVDIINKKLPEIPTALLAYTMDAGAASIERYTRLNTGIDVNLSMMTPEFERFYKDRGMMGFYWTFGTAGQAIGAAEQGFVGLATDEADKFAAASGDYAFKYIKPQKNYAAVSSLEEGQKIDLMGVTYAGNEIACTGTVRYVLETENKYAVVATCDSKKDSAVYMPRLYTQVFYIDKQ